MFFRFQHVFNSDCNMFCVKIYRVFFFLAFMKAVESISTEEFKCSSNLDCPKGTYCYKESALYECAPCSDCKHFFRKNSTVLDCPQRPEQCGECIAGYHSPKLIDGSEPSTCISTSSEILQPMEDINKKSLPPRIPEGKDFGNLYVWLALLGVICIVSLAIAAFYVRRKCNRCNTKGSMPIIGEVQRFCISPSAPPPPYQTSSKLTSHNIEHEAQPKSTHMFGGDIEIKTTGGTGHQIDCEFDRRHQASCYKFPFYVNEGTMAPEQGDQAAPLEEENLPDTFDDSTQPSTWRPVAEDLKKARIKEEKIWGELNTKILSTDIGDETEQLVENENPAGNSGCEETRPFAMISAEHPNFSSSPDMSSSSNNATDMGVQNFSNEPKHKKRRTAEYSEMNSFNLNIFINNANANVNLNNNNM